ncbi:MAG: protein-disulfide reductase DsbD domain-containing protein [Rhodovibrionaceae bacterium]
MGLLLLILGAGQALAAAGPWAENQHSRLRLVSAVSGVGAAESLQFGLQFQLPEGWEIYWRSPGDAGYPPRLDTGASQNLAGLEMDWPVPHRFELFGLQTFGYKGEVVFPLTVTPEQPGEALRLEALVSYLVCEEICVPHEETISLALPAGSGGSDPEAALIAGYAAKVPGIEVEKGLGLERVSLSRDGAGQETLHVVARSETPFRAPDVLVEEAPAFGFGSPTITLEEDGRRAEISLPVRAGAQAEGGLEGRELRLTLTDVDRGVEKRVTPLLASAAGAAPETGGASLPVILGLALLGGLILNLMPCVLPVLSIKLLSVVSHGGGAAGPVRRSFLATAAGVLASFLLLAAGAIALKSAGLAVGWGIQFQQPVFLAFMALVVTLFALNLFGVFEVRLPGGLGDMAARQGAQEGDEKSLTGAFLTGGFATLLATPCSAPFLGTAVGFALARGSLEILAIFLFLGLGLAAPYLLIASFPRLATALPRPGRWMLVLRRLLGLALAATAVWLLSVLLTQSGLWIAAGVAALLLVLAAVTLLRGRLLRPVFLSALLLLSAAVLGLSALPGAQPRQAVAEQSGWRNLDPAGIGALVAEGQVVFVDVTAEWCITCQANKTLVLDRAPVAPALAAGGVTRMRGDWTLPSQEISAYLESFGRYGIPFNAVYGPGAPEGIALPELLSGEAVLEAMERARGG